MQTAGRSCEPFGVSGSACFSFLFLSDSVPCGLRVWLLDWASSADVLKSVEGDGSEGALRRVWSLPASSVVLGGRCRFCALRYGKRVAVVCIA